MDIQEKIEQGVVYGDLLLSSTPRALLNRMADNEQLRAVRCALSESEVAPILCRAEELWDKPVEEGYANPHDMAIAAYIYLVGDRTDSRVSAFVQRVAESERRDVKWSRAVAKYVLAHVPENAIGRHDHTPPPSPEGYEYAG
jgi:hypothetical protein